MATWPVSTRVNKADNDDAGILDRVEAAAGTVLTRTLAPAT
jgi:hypothetical protein